MELKSENLSDAELKQQVPQSAEQLFRLRFQKSLGNNEGVKKLRELKLDIARIKTIARQRELGMRRRRAAPRSRCRRPAAAPRRQPPRKRRRTKPWQSKQAAPPPQSTRPPQREGRHGGLHQDAEDHRGRDRDAQGAPEVQARDKSNKKFYAHDEQNSARIGDVVRIRETRPLSKLKRWQLEEIVRRSALAQLPDVGPTSRRKRFKRRDQAVDRPEQ